MSNAVGQSPSIIIPLPSDTELGPEMAAQVNGQGKNLNDIRMVAGTGELGKPIGALAGTIFRLSGIDAKLRQFIVLRVATLLNCPNLLGPNEQMARNLGASVGELEALRSDSPVKGLDDNGTLIMLATDELTTEGTLADKTLASLLGRYDNEVCRKYIMVICYYNMFARFFNGTRIPGESEEDISKKVGTRTLPV